MLFFSFGLKYTLKCFQQNICVCRNKYNLTVFSLAFLQICSQKRASCSVLNQHACTSNCELQADGHKY